MNKYIEYWVNTVVLNAGKNERKFIPFWILFKYYWIMDIRISPLPEEVTSIHI